MKKSKSFLVGAAISGILSGAIAFAAHADDMTNGMEKGKCVGANNCKGQGACKGEGGCKGNGGCGKSACKSKNDCKGKNSCKGKGFLEMTKAKCEKLAKKYPKRGIYFEEYPETEDET